MRLVEFFNEAQEVELKNPGTLQKVLDAFLSSMAERDSLTPELQAAEARCAVLRSRLDQSKEAGVDKFGKSPGLYGKMTLDSDDMRAVAAALKSVGTPEDAQKLKADLQGMRVEGISAKGAEGLGGHGEGFEVQNQGVTRRFPGEGPGVNGGRTQPQQFDSYDQPQYDPKNEEFMGVRDQDSFDKQDPHQGSQEAGPIAAHEGKEIDDMKRSVSKMKHAVGRASSKLKKSSEKEHEEHPWTTRAQATRIARDHERADKNEGVFRLVEFYALDEGRTYKISIEGNGQGNLTLSGESEMLAAGSADEVVGALIEREPRSAPFRNTLLQAYDAAVKNGTDLIFDPYGSAANAGFPVYEVDKEED
jgi:hypothetical protein